MESQEILADTAIQQALDHWNWTIDACEGRLMLAELLLKSSAGYRSSHTEEGFMREFCLLKSDKTPNKRGRKFLCSMLYTHSNKKPEYFHLMEKYRR